MIFVSFFTTKASQFIEKLIHFGEEWQLLGRAFAMTRCNVWHNSEGSAYSHVPMSCVQVSSNTIFPALTFFSQIDAGLLIKLYHYGEC